MKIAIADFPGSTASDCAYAFGDLLKAEVVCVRSTEDDLENPDAVILPGGYSYGDYLRPGGLAKGSRICGAIRAYADSGRPVLGIGNGFQILCELGLLPGALLPNGSNRFAGGYVHIVVQNKNTPFTKACKSEVLRMPIACYSGRYYLDARTLRDVEQSGGVVFRYSDAEGDVDSKGGETGSVNGIAGVTNKKGNVVGLMPHPERAIEQLIGGTDGLEILRSVFSS